MDKHRSSGGKGSGNPNRSPNRNRTTTFCGRRVFEFVRYGDSECTFASILARIEQQNAQRMAERERESRRRSNQDDNQNVPNTENRDSEVLQNSRDSAHVVTQHERQSEGERNHDSVGPINARFVIGNTRESHAPERTNTSNSPVLSFYDNNHGMRTRNTRKPYENRRHRPNYYVTNDCRRNRSRSRENDRRRSEENERHRSRSRERRERDRKRRNRRSESRENDKYRRGDDGRRHRRSRSRTRPSREKEHSHGRRSRHRSSERRNNEEHRSYTEHSRRSSGRDRTQYAENSNVASSRNVNLPSGERSPADVRTKDFDTRSHYTWSDDSCDEPIPKKIKASGIEPRSVSALQDQSVISKKVTGVGVDLHVQNSTRRPIDNIVQTVEYVPFQVEDISEDESQLHIRTSQEDSRPAFDNLREENAFAETFLTSKDEDENSSSIKNPTSYGIDSGNHVSSIVQGDTVDYVDETGRLLFKRPVRTTDPSSARKVKRIIGFLPVKGKTKTPKPQNFEVPLHEEIEVTIAGSASTNDVETHEERAPSEDTSYGNLDVSSGRFSFSPMSPIQFLPPFYAEQLQQSSLLPDRGAHNLLRQYEEMMKGINVSNKTSDTQVVGKNSSENARMPTQASALDESRGKSTPSAGIPMTNRTEAALDSLIRSGFGVPNTYEKQHSYYQKLNSPEKTCTSDELTREDSPPSDPRLRGREDSRLESQKQRQWPVHTNSEVPPRLNAFNEIDSTLNKMSADNAIIEFGGKDPRSNLISRNLNLLTDVSSTMRMAGPEKTKPVSPSKPGLTTSLPGKFIIPLPDNPLPISLSLEEDLNSSEKRFESARRFTPDSILWSGGQKTIQIVKNQGQQQSESLSQNKKIDIMKTTSREQHKDVRLPNDHSKFSHQSGHENGRGRVSNDYKSSGGTHTQNNSKRKNEDQHKITEQPMKTSSHSVRSPAATDTTSLKIPPQKLCRPQDDCVQGKPVANKPIPKDPATPSPAKLTNTAGITATTPDKQKLRVKDSWAAGETTGLLKTNLKFSSDLMTNVAQKPGTPPKTSPIISQESVPASAPKSDAVKVNDDDSISSFDPRLRSKFYVNMLANKSIEHQTHGGQEIKNQVQVSANEKSIPSHLPSQAHNSVTTAPSVKPNLPQPKLASTPASGTNMTVEDKRSSKSSNKTTVRGSGVLTAEGSGRHTTSTAEDNQAMRKSEKSSKDSRDKMDSSTAQNQHRFSKTSKDVRDSRKAEKITTHAVPDIRENTGVHKNKHQKDLNSPRPASKSGAADSPVKPITIDQPKLAVEFKVPALPRERVNNSKTKTKEKVTAPAHEVTAINHASKTSKGSINSATKVTGVTPTNRKDVKSFSVEDRSNKSLGEVAKRGENPCARKNSNVNNTPKPKNQKAIQHVAPPVQVNSLTDDKGKARVEVSNSEAKRGSRQLCASKPMIVESNDDPIILEEITKGQSKSGPQLSNTCETKEDNKDGDILELNLCGEGENSASTTAGEAEKLWYAPDPDDHPLVARVQLFYGSISPLTRVVTQMTICEILLQHFRKELVQHQDDEQVKILLATFESLAIAKDPYTKTLRVYYKRRAAEQRREKTKELTTYFKNMSMDTCMDIMLAMVHACGYFRMEKYEHTSFRVTFFMVMIQLGRIIAGRKEAVLGEMMGKLFLERLAIETERRILRTPKEMQLIQTFNGDMTHPTAVVRALTQDTKDFIITKVDRPVNKEWAKMDLKEGVEKFEKILLMTKKVADKRGPIQRKEYFRRLAAEEERVRNQPGTNGAATTAPPAAINEGRRPSTKLLRPALKAGQTDRERIQECVEKHFEAYGPIDSRKINPKPAENSAVDHSTTINEGNGETSSGVIADNNTNHSQLKEQVVERSNQDSGLRLHDPAAVQNEIDKNEGTVTNPKSASKEVSNIINRLEKTTSRNANATGYDNNKQTSSKVTKKSK